MAFYDLKSYKAPPPNSINQENQREEKFSLLLSGECQTSYYHILKVSIVCPLTLNYLLPKGNTPTHSSRLIREPRADTGPRKVRTPELQPSVMSCLSLILNLLKKRAVCL